MEKACGRCKYHQMDKKVDRRNWICKNGDSLYFLQSREVYNSCGNFKAEETCRNCFYWQKEPYSDGMVCVSADSEHCSEWTEEDMSCDEWEEIKWDET